MISVLHSTQRYWYFLTYLVTQAPCLHMAVYTAHINRVCRIPIGLAGQPPFAFAVVNVYCEKKNLAWHDTIGASAMVYIAMHRCTITALASMIRRLVGTCPNKLSNGTKSPQAQTAVYWYRLRLVYCYTEQKHFARRTTPKCIRNIQWLYREIALSGSYLYCGGYFIGVGYMASTRKCYMNQPLYCCTYS